MLPVRVSYKKNEKNVPVGPTKLFVCSINQAVKSWAVKAKQ